MKRRVWEENLKSGIGLREWNRGELMKWHEGNEGRKKDGENPFKRERVLWGVLGSCRLKGEGGKKGVWEEEKKGSQGTQQRFLLECLVSVHVCLCPWLWMRGLREQLTHPWPLHSPFAPLYPWGISEMERAWVSIWSLNLISLKLQVLLLLKAWSSEE